MSDALSYLTRCGCDAAVLWCDGQKDLACTRSSPPSAWPTQCHASAGITVVGILDSQGLFLKSATSFTSVCFECWFRRTVWFGSQLSITGECVAQGHPGWSKDKGTLWDELGISVWSLLTLQGHLRFIRILLTPSQHKLCQTWTDSEALVPCDP